MTTSVSLPTAKIYQFPVGGRKAVGGYRTESNASTIQAAPRVASSGWYHDAAIEEASRGSEH